MNEKQSTFKCDCYEIKKYNYTMKINIEIEITEDQIITNLKEWWENNLTNPRIWETKIGKFIKDKLNERGNFKIRIPPVEPIKDLNKFIESYTENPF